MNFHHFLHQFRRGARPPPAQFDPSTVQQLERFYSTNTAYINFLTAKPRMQALMRAVFALHNRALALSSNADSVIVPADETLSTGGTVPGHLQEAVNTLVHQFSCIQKEKRAHSTELDALDVARDWGKRTHTPSLRVQAVRRRLRQIEKCVRTRREHLKRINTGISGWDNDDDDDEHLDVDKLAI